MKITERYYPEKNQDHLAIADANFIGDYVIRLTFNDGHKILVDFKPFLEESNHPSIKKYLNDELFKSFSIQDGNLDWNDFDLYFPIEDLYKNTISKKVIEI
jgi:hypothetical protein